MDSVVFVEREEERPLKEAVKSLSLPVEKQGWANFCLRWEQRQAIRRLDGSAFVLLCTPTLRAAAWVIALAMAAYLALKPFPKSAFYWFVVAIVAATLIRLVWIEVAISNTRIKKVRITGEKIYLFPNASTLGRLTGLSAGFSRTKLHARVLGKLEENPTAALYATLGEEKFCLFVLVDGNILKHIP